MRLLYTIREHEPFETRDGLDEEDLKSLEDIWRNSATPDKDGTVSPVFSRRRNGVLTASNYVGVLTTPRQAVIEILPKIDFGDQDDAGHQKTKKYFLKMLRSYRGLRHAAQLPESSIRAMKQFPMLEVFIRQFLENLQLLARGGLARRYVSVEENLPHLRGRIRFRDHIRRNLTNQARFFVAHDELSANRPANRLICSALEKLERRVQSAENRQSLRHLSAAFANIPKSNNPHADWRKHHVDRSMTHYNPVMQWVGLFLFGHGPATFAGRHLNLSLLFPMEDVFEDFVTRSFSPYQNKYRVMAQGPKECFAEFAPQEFAAEKAFFTKPDISLANNSGVKFILDAKWKRINPNSGDQKHGVSQADIYQLYAYGKQHNCRTVALVYPRTRNFTAPLRYRYFDDLTLLCLPFDITQPEKSVQCALDQLHSRSTP